jgi:predicted transglutaminase-like cysteine proteinase
MNGIAFQAYTPASRPKSTIIISSNYNSVPSLANAPEALIQIKETNPIVPSNLDQSHNTQAVSAPAIQSATETRLKDEKAADDRVYYDGIINEQANNRPKDSSDVKVTPYRDTQPSVYYQIALSQGVMQTLDTVNRSINKAIISTPDQTQFRKNDYWFIPGTDRGARGDCEDYALQKRQTLIEIGYPAEALSLAVVRTQRGELHAVLVLSTTEGDYIMDNLQESIKPWHETNYRWISRQDANNPLNWVSLNG